LNIIAVRPAPDGGGIFERCGMNLDEAFSKTGIYELGLEPEPKNASPDQQKRSLIHRSKIPATGP